MTDISKEKIERLAELEAQVELFGEDIWHAIKKARNDTLREAAIVADEWYMNIGKGTPSGEILSLIDKENTL